jgi:hypothetical protein
MDFSVRYHIEGEQRELHDIKDKSYTPFAFKIKIHINESN